VEIRRAFAALRTGTYQQLQIAELPAARRITHSLIEMAVITGILTRAYRALALTYGGDSFGFYVVTVVVGAVFLFGMLTLHVSNYQLKQWLWRVPAFALAESVTEILASLLLISLGREPWGSVRARYHDWPFIAADTVAIRVGMLCVFGLLLAGIVQWVRFAMLRHQHRL
jgi:hypothetical protein